MYKAKYKKSMSKFKISLSLLFIIMVCGTAIIKVYDEEQERAIVIQSNSSLDGASIKSNYNEKIVDYTGLLTLANECPNAIVTIIEDGEKITLKEASDKNCKFKVLVLCNDDVVVQLKFICQKNL